MGLRKFARTADQRDDTLAREPSAIGSEGSPQRFLRAGQRRQHVLEGSVARRQHRRRDGWLAEFDRRDMTERTVVVRIEFGQSSFDLMIERERIGIRQRTISHAHGALLGDNVAREPSGDSAEIHYVVGCVGKKRSHLPVAHIATLGLKLSDYVERLAHHGNRVDAKFGITAMTAASAHLDLEGADALVRIVNRLRGRFANPGEIRTRYVTEYILQCGGDTRSAAHPNFL